MKSKKYSQIIVVVCVVACIFLQIVISSTSVVNEVTIGNIVFPMGSLRGILQALIGFICIIMVSVSPKYGRIVALVMLSVAMILMIFALVATKSSSPLNGIVFNIVSIISVVIISRQINKIEKFGITDDVTGLGNKKYIERVISERLNQRKKVYLMKIRIKNIRAICDTLGYEYGDLALKMLADRFEQVLAGEGILGKLDGLEYAVVVKEASNPEEIADRLLKSSYEKLEIDKNGVKNNCYISAYIGIACYPRDASDCAGLLKCADIAMYKSVKEKSKVPKEYNEEMAQEITRRNELEQIIKESLEKDYFYMVYQPQYEVATKRLRGFESLIRLRMPNGTFISPGEFIPVAEATDLILRIDDYVLKRTMAEFRDVIKEANNSVLLSVNVSAKNMGSNDFVDRVKAIIEMTQFPAECLEIEITEYSLGKSKKQTINNIKELRKLGVMVALDDFGTGYTSLEQLLHLPISLLKIDKSLVDSIEEDQVSRDFVDAVIYMGHLMECEVITEGVETVKQLELLKEHECDFVQGYVWGRPMEYCDAIALVAEVSN